jgi:LysM repeat protein
MHTIAAAPSYVAVVPVRYRSGRPSQATFVRRRVMVAVLGVTLMIAGWVGLGGAAPSSAARPAGQIAVAPTYVVQPGDTMWSIASRHAGGGSHTRYVDALVELNGGTRITAGQQILLPTP